MAVGLANVEVYRVGDHRVLQVQEHNEVLLALLDEVLQLLLEGAGEPEVGSQVFVEGGPQTGPDGGEAAPAGFSVDVVDVLEFLGVDDAGSELEDFFEAVDCEDLGGVLEVLELGVGRSTSRFSALSESSAWREVSLSSYLLICSSCL